MTEVENCGGGHRTRLKINLCLYGVPPPPYIKEGRRRPASPKGRAQGGVEFYSKYELVPPFLVQVGEEGRRGRGRGKEGPRPPPLVLFGLPLGGHHLLATALSLP